MKKTLMPVLATIMFSAQSFAGCLTAAQNAARQQGLTLVGRTGTVLAPGADSFTGYGELFNPTDSTVEVFVAQQLSQFGTHYKGLLLEQGTCRYLGHIALEDDFDR